MPDSQEEHFSPLSDNECRKYRRFFSFLEISVNINMTTYFCRESQFKKKCFKSTVDRTIYTGLKRSLSSICFLYSLSIFKLKNNILKTSFFSLFFLNIIILFTYLLIRYRIILYPVVLADYI